MAFNCKEKSTVYNVEWQYIDNAWLPVVCICAQNLYPKEQIVPNVEGLAIDSDGTDLLYSWTPSDLYYTYTDVQVNDGAWQFWVPRDWGGDSPGAADWSYPLAFYGAQVGDTVIVRMRFADGEFFPDVTQFSQKYAIARMTIAGAPDVEGLTIATGGRTVKFKWTPADYEVHAQYKFNSDDWVDLDPIDGNDGVSFFNSSDQTGDTIQVRLKYLDDPYESINWAVSDVATITAPFLFFTGTSEPNLSNFINSISTNTELGFTADGNNIFVDDPAGITGIEFTNQHGDVAGTFDFSFCHNLEYCYLYSNNVTSVDLSDCIVLNSAHFGSNPLTEINLTGCVNLSQLSVYETQLISLDISETNLNYCDAENISTLTSIIATGLTGDGGKVYLDFYNCNLDAPAINDFFDSLGTAADTDKSYISIYNNPGALLCNPKIATDKGWTIDGGPILIFVGSDTVDVNDFINGAITNSEVSFIQWDNNIYADNIDPIAAFDLSGSDIQGEMYLNDNNLTSLDLHGLTGLTILECYDGNLINVNLNGCSGLENLKCYDNDIDTLTITNCTSLTYIDCGNNSLTALAIPSCPLVYLACYNNSISSLDLSNLNLLEECYASNSVVSTLTLTGCTSLTRLEANDGGYTTLNATGLTALESLYAGSCSSLTTITLTGCSSIIYINASGSSNLNSLGFAGIKNTIQSIYMDGCGFTSIDLSDATELTEINAATNNALSTVDLSGCTSLINIYLHSTGLTSLDVSGDTVLNYVYLPSTSLTDTAIDAIFTALPTKSGSINVQSCPGAGTCTPSIATDKGWTVQS